MDLTIHPDIAQAYTLPSKFYTDQALFDQAKEKIFARAWHCIGLKSDVEGKSSTQPFSLLDGFLNEPLILVNDEAGNLRCLSNVCTHRGNLLVSEGGSCNEIRCRYHGRRFDLKGKFISMPEFKEARSFPTSSDDLPEIPLKTLGDLLFTSLNASVPFETWMGPIQERIGWIPMEDFQHSIEHSQAYTIQAHWALYCDNYLEGFHIPFVHPGLNGTLNYADYAYEIFPNGSLQVGIARDGQPIFDLPSGHKDHGKKVAAYYFWLFPNLMLNFYPWGLSLNLIEPISLAETRVRFETFIWKPDLYDEEHRDLLHMTELEDEAIVESVQLGVQSRLYKKGRFSPKMEVAVHHFHRLLSEQLK